MFNRRDSRMRRTFAAGSVALLALVAAACGDDDDEASTTTAAEETATTEAAPATTEAAPATTEAAPETTEAAPETTEATESTEPATTEPAAGDGIEAIACPDVEGALVGYSEPLPDPNFALIEAILESELGRVGATLEPVNANLDPGKQISDIQALVQQGVDVLMINPVDPTAVQDVLAEVEVPVVVQDTQFGGPYFTNVTADVESAARRGAEQLKAIVGDGPVAAVIGPPFAEVLVREAETFQPVAEEVGLNLVDVQTTSNPGAPDPAAQFANGWKVQYGSDLAGIWTFNDTSAVGVASTFDDSFSPALVSINGQPEAIPLLEEGVIDVTYDLQQDMIARALAYAAVAAICGVEVPESIWIESIELTPENAGDWVNPGERGLEPLETTLEERGEQTFFVPAG